jgi:hypothetical protein
MTPALASGRSETGRVPVGFDQEKLVLRRQFILGSHSIDWFPNWRTTAINSPANHVVTSHPDLDVSQVRNGWGEVTLIGYLLDPEHPAMTDEEVLKGLCADAQGPADLVRLTDRMAGRWIMVVASHESTYLFHDPAGLRQVVFTQDSEGDVWCATQPGLLQKVLCLETNSESLGFARSAYYRRDRQAWWPGDATICEGVRHLLPNHQLDLRSGEVRRYWPCRPLEATSLAVAEERGAEILEAVMKAAATRFPLAFGITAGWDSRLLLASSRSIAKDIYFFTLVLHEMHPQSADVRVSGDLLKGLGLEHHLISCPHPREYTRMDDPAVRAFREIYASNFSGAHDVWSASAYAMMLEYPEGRVWVRGNVSEIVRYMSYFFSKREYPDRVTPDHLARLLGMTNDDGTPVGFAVRHLEKWWEGVEPVTREYGYDPHALLYWEQRMGRWQAQNQTERDIVQEAVTPYNCRALLTLLLGVDSAHVMGDNRLYAGMIRRLWPEVGAFPVNPSTRLSGRSLLRKTARRCLRGARRAFRLG